MPITAARRLTTGSVEYLGVWIDSAGTVTLSTQSVDIAIQPRRTPPNGATTWVAAAWTGAPGNARAASILIGPGTDNPTPAGTYDVWARVTDTPEVPEIPCGRLTVY